MDEALATQFHRVEAALGTLVDSIASYNPSPQAAIDLVAADDELTHGLDQLAQHQANHARIQALRAEADTLEDQLKSSVATLATLRHELFETRATTFAEDSRPVPFDELLQYAKNIAKYTIPPTYRERVPIPPADTEKPKEDGGSSGAPTGMNTPINASGALTQQTNDGQKESEGENEKEAATKDITAEEAEWLKKLNDSQMAWFPWPDNDKIRRGNLMAIQEKIDRGEDPTSLDLPRLIDAQKKEQGVPDAPIQAIQEPPPQPQVQEPAAPAPIPPSVPQAPQAQFTGFDYIDDD